MKLEIFDGFVGYRWSALFDPTGTLQTSTQAPGNARDRLGFVKRLLDRPESPQGNADLYFANGLVIIRRGAFGLLILFCETSLNPSLLGFMLADLDPSPGPDTSSGTLALASSTRHVLSLTAEITAEPVPAETISALLALFTEYLGPLAPKLAQKDARAHGLDLDRIPPKQWADLLNLLAARFSDEAKRDSFLGRAVLLKARF